MYARGEDTPFLLSIESLLRLTSKRVNARVAKGLERGGVFFSPHGVFTFTRRCVVERFSWFQFLEGKAEVGYGTVVRSRGEGGALLRGDTAARRS